MEQIKQFVIFPFVVFSILGIIACSTDNDEIEGRNTDVLEIEANQLQIQSDQGQKEIGVACNLHGFRGIEEVYEPDGMVKNVYFMTLTCDIRESKVFDFLTIEFEDIIESFFENMSSGDIFDCSQFKASVSCVHNRPETIMIESVATDGLLKVIDKKMTNGNSVITIELENLKFVSKVNNNTYTINGLLDYAIH